MHVMTCFISNVNIPGRRLNFLTLNHIEEKVRIEKKCFLHLNIFPDKEKSKTTGHHGPGLPQGCEVISYQANR